MRKLNYLDNISYIKINNKNIYIKSNKNIHLLDIFRILKLFKS